VYLYLACRFTAGCRRYKQKAQATLEVVRAFLQFKEKLLLGLFFAFLFEVFFAVLFLEAFDSACGIDVFLLAGIERMAGRADFCVDFLGGAERLEGISAPATHRHLMVSRMNIFLHIKTPTNLKTGILTPLKSFSSLIFHILLNEVKSRCLQSGFSHATPQRCPCYAAILPQRKKDSVISHVY
jgi:hypothetical protein